MLPPDPIDDLAAAGHYGLIGMKERVDVIGGRLSIMSAHRSVMNDLTHRPGPIHSMSFADDLSVE